MDPADATFHSIEDVDWASFYLADVPDLFHKCCTAMGINQAISFSDELPLQASWNSLNQDDPENPRMYIGIGNLEAFPFASLIAVILHELGHIFCYRSEKYDAILANSMKRQRELLVDVLAGGGFAKMEAMDFTVMETVWGQCSQIEMPINGTWIDGEAYSPPAPEQTTNKPRLDARRLTSNAGGVANFKVLRPDGSVEPLHNYGMIGQTPDEDPDRKRCLTRHDRAVDFMSMVGAASGWRTFGDLPNEVESHGSQRDRHEAFTFGYDMCKGNMRPLSECLTEGSKWLGVRL